jgi:PAS domain S-box-containing protein
MRGSALWSRSVLSAASRVITNLQARLLAAFAVVLLLVVAESVATYFTIQQDRAASDWVRHTDQVLTLANAAQDRISDMGLRYEEFLRTGDEASAAAYQEDVNAYPAQLTALAALTSDNPPQVEKWQSIAQEIERVRSQVTDPAISQRRQINPGQAGSESQPGIDPSGAGEQAFSGINATFNAAIATERTLLTERARVADQADTDLQNLLVWGTAVTVIIGVAIAVGLATRIGQAMDRFASVAQAIAGGNLSQRIHLRRHDEIGRAAAAFDRMADALEADRMERVRAQAQAEFLRQQTESILSSAAEGIYSQDPDGICVLVNPAVSKMSGFSVDELRGALIHSVLHHSHPDGSPYRLEDCPILGVQNRGEPIHSLEDVFWRKDGSSFPVEFTAVPTRRDDAITGVVVTFHDITERRAIDRMKNEFISIASHELRTPLTSLRGSLGLVGSGLLGTIPERADHMIKMAISNADRLIRLINDILDIERIESGRTTMELRPTDLAEVVRQTIDSMAATAEAAHVRLITQVDPLSVEADADRLHQTLVNLIGNAIKFSTAGSTVTVSAHANGSETVISVRDTGRGIPPDKLGAIFEPFEQVDSSDARQKGGTGLGLAISRSIIHQHGGRIWVESALGEGSTFSFTLPLVQNQRSMTPSANGTHRVPILVCDDDADTLRVVGEMLRTHGYHPIGVQTGQEAVDRSAAEQPAAILLDLAMPGMDGWETLVALKSRAETRDIPVLILSGVERTGVEPADTTEAWMSKPVSATIVGDVLKRVLGRRPGPPRVLVVEDDPALAVILADGLAASGVETRSADTSSDAITLASQSDPDLLLLDLSLAAGSGLEVVDWMRERDQLQRVPIVVYSGRDLRDLDPSESERLRDEPARAVEFLTKSRISPEAVQDRVIALLRHFT